MFGIGRMFIDWGGLVFGVGGGVVAGGVGK